MDPILRGGAALGFNEILIMFSSFLFVTYSSLVIIPFREERWLWEEGK
jgi:hypothetical protein